ncbi:hypothetical protein MKEN_00858000 [Mycena kentingensis (nom. inval.)]|nr:hypothetical protein MKEN_00858000 [Mycena kentingensis (nom. inval.)]
MKHIGRSPPYSESVLNTSIRPYTTPSIISAREYYVTSSPPTSDLANEYPHFAEASPALAHRLPTSVIAYPTSAIAYPASQSSVPPRHRLSRPFLVCAAPLSSPPLRHRKNPSWRRTWARSLVISLPGMVVLLVAGSLERNERGSEPGSIGNVAVTGRGRRRSIVFSTVLDRARGGGTHPASPTSTGLRSERQNGVGNWSQDGQLFFLSKTHVYILTPAAGVHSTSLPPPGPNQFSHVRWFSTVIDFNPRQAYSWCLASKAFGALSLGSLDVGLRAVACSPSSMTANGSSVAAILSENMDLTLWQSVQNTPTGEWAMICDATPFLVEVSSKQTQSADAKILRTQTVGMLWSPRADFSLWPAPSVDSSLLATGTRAGTLNLFRFAQTTLEHVSTVDISDEWITHLAFTPWKTTKQGESHTSLAYGTATGAVGLVRITQTLVPIVHAIGFCPAYKIETRLEKIEKPVFEPTTAGITALACIHPLGQPVLVRATPGVISLWTPAAKLRWSGHRSIRLSTQKLTAGSSAFNPVSGLSYIPQEDALLVSLSDGTMHVIEAGRSLPETTLRTFVMFSIKPNSTAPLTALQR